MSAAPSLLISLEYGTHDQFFVMLDKYAHVDTLFLPDHDLPLSTRVQVQIYISSEPTPIALEGIVAWSYPKENVPKGRLSGIGVRLEQVDDQRWTRYLIGRVPSILATFPGDSIPLPSLSAEEYRQWEEKDRARQFPFSSDDDESNFLPGQTSSDLSQTLYSQAQACSLGSSSKDATEDGSNREPPPIQGIGHHETIHAKRPLPTPHRWPPSKPPEKVTTRTFSMEEVKEATDLVPTKSYSNPGQKAKQN